MSFWNKGLLQRPGPPVLGSRKKEEGLCAGCFGEELCLYISVSPTQSKGQCLHRRNKGPSFHFIVCCDIWQVLVPHHSANRRTFSAYPAPLSQDNEVLRVNVPREQSLSLWLSLAIRIEAVKGDEDQFLCLAGKTH